MANLSMYGSGSAGQIADLISREVVSGALSCEIVGSVRRIAGSAEIYLLVFDKYYMRASNRASLSVLVTGEGGRVTVDAVGAGGGQGALFRFSWGAEENFVGAVEKILRGQGFEVQ